MGYLELILGPMFSGKTSRLIQIKKKYTILDYSILVIKPMIDNRYSKNSVIVNHDQEITECVSRELLGDILHVDQYQVILVEEAQFFSDLYEKVVEWSKTKKVYVAGLNGDYKQNLFGDLYKLIPYADEIVFLKALCRICKDGTPAPFTKKGIDNDKIVEVGGDNMYSAVCRNHLELEN
jgi:thymidine kinase